MKRGATFVALASLAVATDARAQKIAPTDTDLHAAYCVAWLSHENDMLRQMMPPPSVAAKLAGDPATAESFGKSQQVANTMQSNARRLQTYVYLRMLYVDPWGILLAEKQGEYDWNEAFQAPMDAAARCKNDDLTVQAACVASTVKNAPDSPDIDAKARSCNDLSWLPL